ncbi:MAG: tetratricopeptide repeat protein, partial [Opitutaceae bacterium]|nr:tetratricopeptide repeat protein [Opitutaceae bacterium]
MNAGRLVNMRLLTVLIRLPFLFGIHVKEERGAAKGSGSASCLRGERWLHLYPVRILWIFFCSSICLSSGLAQLDEEVTPLLIEGGVSETALISVLWDVGLADQAFRSGFYTIAESLYREALKGEALTGAIRDEMILSLVGCLIAQEKTEAAQKELNAYEGLKEGRYILWSSFLAYQLGDLDEIGESLLKIEVGGLLPEDVGWYHFLRGVVASYDGEDEDALRAFDEALETALSEAQRTQFQLGQFQVRLVSEKIDEVLEAQLHQKVNDYRGRRVGFRFAQQYSVVLDRLGKKTEALGVLQNQIEMVAGEDGEIRDQLLLLQGMIAGVDSGVGRDAFRELLLTGSQKDLQHTALLKLAGVVLHGGSGVQSSEFLNLANSLIDREVPHVLLEELLSFRAQLALQNGQFDLAERDAERLLSQFPGSSLKVNTLSVLASAAWQRQRYRTAAGYLGQIRGMLPEGERKAELGVLLADCYFRAGLQSKDPEDFRNAAEAYRIVMEEDSTKISKGLLFYQRVLAEIHSDQSDRAKSLLDEASSLEGVDAINRWKAEWALVKAMEADGRIEIAFERIESLVQEDLPPDLRLRFYWLLARLSIDSGKPEETAQLVSEVESLAETLSEGVVEEGVVSHVLSYSLLLRAQAAFALDQGDEAIATLEILRERYPESEAAIFSFIIQARVLSESNRTVEAQQLLIYMADNFSSSPFAPMALYEAALNAEKRGEATYLTEANQLLERLVRDYPEKEEFVFFSRLKQADVLRQLNQFSAAQHIYEFLENKFPNRPDQILAQLSLADCLMAQVSNDPSKLGGAISILERLMDLPNAPVDLRVEAGYKLAMARENNGDRMRSKQIRWMLFVTFVQEEANSKQLKATGRYWMARSLLELGEMEESEGERENGRKAYESILRYNLPGTTLAKARLSGLL